MEVRRAPWILWTLVFVRFLWSCAPAAVAPSADARAQERPDTVLPAPGAQYLAEVLFRDEITGRLYLGRTLLGASSRSDPTRAAPLPAIGLDEAGSVIAPPSRRELRPPPLRELFAGERNLPPLAASTTWYGFRLEPEFAPPGSVMVHESDLGTIMELPKREGDTSVIIFQGAAFRVKRLSLEEALSFSPLRQDPRFFRRRSAELMEELLTVYRTAITATEDALSGAAVLLRDRAIVGEVRERLDDWIGRTPDEVRGESFPNALCDALVKVGGEEDFDRFRRLLEFHPGQASRLAYRIPLMAKRLGLRPARRILLDLLGDGTTAMSEPWVAAQLRRLDPSVPTHTVGDETLIHMVSSFDLDPAHFGFSNGRPRLLELLKMQANGDGVEGGPNVARLLQRSSPFWLILDEKERARGVRKMREWLDGQIQRGGSKCR